MQTHIKKWENMKHSKINGIAAKAVRVSNEELIELIDIEFALLPIPQKGSVITMLGLKILALMHVLERIEPKAEKLLLSYVFNTADELTVSNAVNSRMANQFEMYLKGMALTLLGLKLEQSKAKQEDESLSARIAINTACHDLLTLANITILKKETGDKLDLLGSSIASYMTALRTLIGDQAFKDLGPLVHHVSIMRAATRTEEENEELRKEHFSSKSDMPTPTHKAPKAKQ